jgi:hypothetical protein
MFAVFLLTLAALCGLGGWRLKILKSFPAQWESEDGLELLSQRRYDL